MIKGAYKQEDLDRMLLEVMEDAKKADIPIDETIEKKVYVDVGTVDRAGFCNWCFRKYEIHITDKLLKTDDAANIKDVLAHEILHTCFLGKTHNYPWLMWANIMNEKYGYHIKEKCSDWKELGVKHERFCQLLSKNDV